MNDEISYKKESDKLLSTLNFIERLWQINWVLKIIGMTLYFDVVLIVVCQTALLKWPISVAFLSTNFGNLIIAFVIFGLYAAFFIPALEIILKKSYLNFLITYSHDKAFNEYYRNSGQHIRINDLEDAAIEEESVFKKKRVDEYYAKTQQIENANRQNTQLFLMVLVLVLFNWLFPKYFLQTESLSVINAFIAFLGVLSYIVICVACILLIFFITKLWEYKNNSSRWLVDPVLAKKIFPPQQPSYRKHTIENLTSKLK